MGKRDLRWLLLSPYKLSFRPPLVYVRKAIAGWPRWRSRRKWLREMRRRGAIIDSSLELRGRANIQDWVELSDGTIIERDCTFWCAEEEGNEPRLRLGTHVYVGRNTYLGAWKPLVIGDDTLIGAYSYIIAGNHRFLDLHIPIRLQGYEGAAVTIGRNVWIGCHVIVLPGVTIGDGAVVGAGSVVTRSIAPEEIWSGVPARKIASRRASTNGD
jgi:acetyltransferase-like isoleucine patch superfamily enzyme